MPSVSATLRHLSAQGLDARVLREALRQTTGDGGHGDERVRSSPRAVPAAETNKSVSFSDVDQLRNTTPEFAGTRSSRYDIRARRRAADRRKQRLKEQPAAAAVAPAAAVTAAETAVVAAAETEKVTAAVTATNDGDSSNSTRKNVRNDAESRVRHVLTQGCCSLLCCREVVQHCHCALRC